MSSKLKKKMSSLRNILVKFRNIKDIEKILKAPRRNSDPLEAKISTPLFVPVKTRDWKDIYFKQFHALRRKIRLKSICSRYFEFLKNSVINIFLQWYNRDFRYRSWHISNLDWYVRGLWKTDGISH